MNKKELKLNIQEKLEKELNEILAEIMAENNINTGDITFDQAIKLDQLTDTMSTLFTEICEQNK